MSYTEAKQKYAALGVDTEAALDKLKPKLTDLKHVRYNYEILERDSAPNDNQHVILKDHHYDEHASLHDDEFR